MKQRMLIILFLILTTCLCIGGCNDSDDSKTSMTTLEGYISAGQTAVDAQDRILIVDTRISTEYINGHITDALNIPYDMVAEDDKPLYTNGYNEVSTTASDELPASWFTHILVNQLVNDFSSTYRDSKIIFYGDDAGAAKKIARTIGYTDVSVLNASYDKWAANHADMTAMYAPGVVSLDETEKTFEFTGLINSGNYANVSERGTHHGIVYKGGGSAWKSMLQADIPPFCFQEMLTYLGASPEGNMADGIYYGTEEEYGIKHTNGQRVDYSITWDGADQYYAIEDLFEEMPSEYDPTPEAFTTLGMEERIGGTRESNILWNPGCIFCAYSCVCGITSNSKANEEVWNADGGIYDLINQPDDPRNFYAGRYYPKADLLPGPGEAIRIRVTVVTDDIAETSAQALLTYVQNGNTAENAQDRIIVVDTRSSEKYIEGHIKDALNVPYQMVQKAGQPLYTNNYDTISVDASTALADSWFTHMLVNQLTNDFVSTYADSPIIFYGDSCYTVAKAAAKIGYTDVSVLNAVYEDWAADHADLTEMFGPGVVSLDKEEKSFVFTGAINSANYENVSTRATHHGITYKGGALSFYSFIQTDIPPFCFHELLVYLGVNPEGNMADGIYYGTEEEYGSKYPDGDRIDFSVTWDGADRYYDLSDLFEEKASEYDPDPDSFDVLGIEARMGGTRDSNLLWNPGCIFCLYACVCGISSNDKANEDTWFADGGIYDTFGQPDNPRNYYAGRYYPRADLMPASGEPIQVKVTVTP